MNSELGIEIRGLTKALRGRTILEDVDLGVPVGSVALVEGANGAGKTTLIRILATVVAPDAGTVRVNGFDVSSQALDVRRSIGVSFANERSLYWRITGVENLRLFGRIAGLSKAAIAERSEELIDALVLGDVASGQVAQMSTGQRQRLMVARSLLADPKVVLLDEPFRGLDQVGLDALIRLIRSRTAEGMTTLVAAPLVGALLTLAHATYRIEGGHLLPAGARRADDGAEGSP